MIYKSYKKGIDDDNDTYTKSRIDDRNALSRNSSSKGSNSSERKSKLHDDKKERNGRKMTIHWKWTQFFYIHNLGSTIKVTQLASHTYNCVHGYIFADIFQRRSFFTCQQAIYIMLLFPPHIHAKWRSICTTRHQKNSSIRVTDTKRCH